ncbi:hypothetical protein [Alteromonas sediminis]|uniref:hypothetical protein n=1 Tax=Alteromonas sediminis TaxID=2259342 RepID=UPI00140448C4|nr:hypothetical protein [Alteromonas sediminis]
MTLLIILGVLFVTLAVTVTLLEKSSFRMKSEDMAKWTKWIWPLVFILIIVQFIQMAF